MFGCQGGSEQRIEVFVKIQKKNQGGGLGRGSGWGGGWSGWMWTKKWSFCKNLKIQIRSGLGVGRGVGVGRVGGGWLVAILGVGGDFGYGRCVPRIEGIVQCTKGIVQY